MGRHQHRQRRKRSSVTVRHNLGLMVLGIVLLFMGNLAVSFLMQGNWRGAVLTLAAGAGLAFVTIYPGR